MTLTERIAVIEAQQRVNSNVIPFERRVAERRQVARWIEVQREKQTGKDLTGYIGGGDAA